MDLLIEQSESLIFHIYNKKGLKVTAVYDVDLV